MNPEAPQASESERLKSLAGEYFDYFIVDFADKDSLVAAGNKLNELRIVRKTIDVGNENPDTAKLASIQSVLLSEHANLMDLALDRLKPLFKYGSLIAYGRKGSLSSDIEPIGADLWDHIVFRHFKDNTVTSKDGTLTFYGVRVYWHENRPDAPAAADHEAHETKQKAKNQGGRPPTFRWDDIIDCLILILMQRGLPETQKQMLEFVRQAARDSGHEGEPEDSTIRATIGKRFPKFFNKSKAIK